MQRSINVVAADKRDLNISFPIAILDLICSQWRWRFV